MAGGTMCYRDALQRPARPSSLSVGSRVHVIPKREFLSSTHWTVPEAISRQLPFNAGRAQGQAQYGQYASSPMCGTPAPAPSLPVREDSRKTALVAPSEIRICPQPQTPHKDQYERLYGTFETRQKRELFQESRYSSKGTRAGSSYWTRRLPQNWREQKSTLQDHIPGWEKGTAFAREKLPARSTSSLCRVYPRDGTGKVHGVKDSDSRQSHGPAASTDDENTWPGRPMRKSETRDYQRGSPHARENTRANAQSPVSQTEPVPQSLLQMMPKLREELDSLDESWKSFQEAWTALLKDRRSANDRTWPTLLQVLGKMTEQVLSPDYSDQHADLPGESVTLRSPSSPTPGQRGDLSSDRDETPSSFMPLSSSSPSGLKYVRNNTDSQSSCEPGDSSSSAASKSSSIDDVDGVFPQSESSGVDMPNFAAGTQKMGVTSSYREDVECSESPRDLFQPHSGALCPDLMYGLSVTVQHNESSSELKEYRASFLNDSSEEHSLVDSMEWPSSSQGTPVAFVDEGSEEESSGCEEVLKPKCSFREKASASVCVQESGNKPIAPTTCSPAFQRLPLRPLQQNYQVLQQKSPLRESVAASITRTSLALEPFMNGKTPSSASPGSRTDWPSPQQNLCQRQLTPDECFTRWAES